MIERLFERVGNGAHNRLALGRRAGNDVNVEGRVVDDALQEGVHILDRAEQVLLGILGDSQIGDLAALNLHVDGHVAVQVRAGTGVFAVGNLGDIQRAGLFNHDHGRVDIFNGGAEHGAGSAAILIEGVEKLHGTHYTPMPDRIVAGTLLCAGAITGGEVELMDAPVEDLHAVCAKLREMGCTLHEGKESIRLAAPERLSAFSVLQTQPHPGFPTDMQAQMLALLSVSEGTGVIVENVFENRFGHAGDLNRMGARILCSGRTAIVRGVPFLTGAHVTARDLRGGAALVLAGLRAQGETIIEHAELIDRGYERLEDQLCRLGADVTRMDTTI